MKYLVSVAAIALMTASAAPSFAATQHSKLLGNHRHQAQASQTLNKGAKSNSRSASNGPVSDVPRDRIQCKQVGGSWSEQTNTCNEKSKM